MLYSSGMMGEQKMLNNRQNILKIKKTETQYTEREKNIIK